MMLGIIVDDSIVVVSILIINTKKPMTHIMQRISRRTKIFGPCNGSSLTTVLGFAPVFLISGVIGQVIEAIPLVVISVILASLFECFFQCH